MCPITGTRMRPPDAGAVTLVHGRRKRPADAQRLVLPERLAEVLQHGHGQALATVSPPDKHRVEDGQQVARTCAIATQAACGVNRETGSVPPIPGLVLTRQGPAGRPHGQATGTIRKRDELHRLRAGDRGADHSRPPSARTLLDAALNRTADLATEQSQAVHAPRPQTLSHRARSQRPLAPLRGVWAALRSPRPRGTWAGRPPHTALGRRLVSATLTRAPCVQIWQSAFAPNRLNPVSHKTSMTLLSRARQGTVASFPLFYPERNLTAARANASTVAVSAKGT